MTARARAAYDRGDTTYVHTVPVNASSASLNMWIKRIEGVGWKLQGQPAQSVAPWPAKGKVQWTLTFTRP